MNENNSTVRRYLPMTLVLLIWGFMNVPATYALREMPPLELLLLRTAIAVVILAPLAYGRERRLLPDRGDLTIAVLMGISGVLINNLCFFYAIKFTSLTNIAIIFATSPLITTILAAVFLGERLTLRRACGIILALSGAVCLLCKGDLSLLANLSLNKGDLMEFCASFCCSVMTVLGKKITKSSPIVVTLCNMVASCVLTAALIAVVGQPMNLALSGRALAGTLYIGILGSGCAYVLQQTSIQRIGAGATGAFLNGSPVVSIFAAMVFMEESLSMIQAACAAVIFAGIFLNAGGERRSGSVDSQTKSPDSAP
ncbi:DMT family transporter [Pyramidobacter porci]